ncbi:MAG: PAS domain-containing protein [Rhizobiaceae bacterium]
MDQISARVGSDDARYLAFEHIPLALVLTDSRADDNPIVYVNRAFETITGYSQASSLGRNCRFLQGRETEKATVAQIRAALSAGQEITTDILNYRADGTPFWNRLHVTPLADGDGDVRYFMGVQRMLGSRREAVIAGGMEDEPLREITHRVKNHLAMIVSLIRMQSRQPVVDPRADYQNLARRVESLQLLYQELSDTGLGSVHSERVALGAYVSRVVSAISYISGRTGIRVNTDIEFVESSLHAAAQVGLILSEILTNAYQHAFDGREDGLIEVSLRRRDGVVRLQVADDGNGIPEGKRWPESGSLGGRLVRSLTAGLDARLSIDGNAGGTRITLDIPVQGAIVVPGIRS